MKQRKNSSCYLFFAVLFYFIGASFEFINPIPVSPQIIKPKQINEGELSTTTENISRYNRQLDSDVESRFRITPNTIIRTGDSRTLGAKFINFTGLPSNHDCLTWCLETPNCNVAVYEVKDTQSCYMFNCGGPEASLCNFTEHSSFVSSVLKVTQIYYDLRQWGNQMKHEHELAELRRSDNINHSSSTSPVEQKSEPVTSEPPPSLNMPAKPENLCHHYQFKCLNSTECIAIYNVCDGIPQCPDGSDESTELKCHEKENKIPPHKIEKPVESRISNNNPHLPENRVSNPNLGSKATHSAVAIQKSPPNSYAPLQHVNLNRQENRDDSRRTGENKNIWPNRPPAIPSRKEYYHHNEDRGNADSNGLGSPFVHKHSQFVAANDAHVQNLNRWSNDYDQYPPHSSAIDQQYSPYDNNNYQRIEDQYVPNQLSSDYDTVKGYGNYRQEDIPYWSNQDTSFPVDEYPQSAMRTMSKQNNYPDKDSMYAQQLARTADQYPEIKHHIMHKPPDPIPEVPQQRTPDIDNYKSHRVSLQRQQPYLTYDESLQKQLYPDLKPKSYPSANLEDPVYNSDDLIRASLVNQLPIEMDNTHHPYQYNMKHSKESAPPHEQAKIKEHHERKEPAKDSLIIVKTTKPPKSVQRTVLDFKMSVTELYQSSRTRSQEANSAILALVMGLTITFLLFIFLACRIKTIRKRMSRKGRALAHDADYLVNGMYL